MFYSYMSLVHRTMWQEHDIKKIFSSKTKKETIQKILSNNSNKKRAFVSLKKKKSNNSSELSIKILFNKEKFNPPQLGLFSKRRERKEEGLKRQITVQRTPRDF